MAIVAVDGHRRCDANSEFECICREADRGVLIAHAGTRIMIGSDRKWVQWLNVDQ